MKIYFTVTPKTLDFSRFPTAFILCVTDVTVNFGKTELFLAVLFYNYIGITVTSVTSVTLLVVGIKNNRHLWRLSACIKN